MRIKNWTTPGTGPGYLRDPLMAEYPAMLRKVAATTLETGPQEGMIDATDDLGDASQKRIPRKTGDLAASRRDLVIDNGAVIHDSGN